MSDPQGPENAALDPSSDGSTVVITALELGGWGPIREPLRLDLTWPVTVLVGRNGSGKTVLLEGIAAGLCSPMGEAPVIQMDDAHPTQFAVEWWRRGRFRYEYASLVARRQRLTIRPTDVAPKWTERCVALDDGELLWDQDGGRLNLEAASRIVIAPDQSFLRLATEDVSSEESGAWRAPHHMLREMGRDLHLVWAELGRLSREPLVLHRPKASPDTFPMWEVADEGAFAGVTCRHLAPLIHWWSLHAPEAMAELEALGRRTGVLDTVHAAPIRPGDPDRVEVLVDGVNLGLHSDGTIRALAILVDLIALSPGGLLLIDEIESSFHPGLLSRILEELSAYAGDLQIILSTQSFRVVDWARPEQIRVVEHEGGNIRVRAIAEEKVRWLKEHLDSSFTLSDHVYGGGLDDP